MQDDHRVGIKRPHRLTNISEMPPNSSFAIFRQRLQKHVHLHWHEFYELGFILAGAGTHVVNGIPHPLRPGSMFMLTPADFHELLPDSGTVLEAFNVIFSGEILGEELRQFIFTDRHDYAAVEAEDFSLLATNFQRLMTEAGEQPWAHQLAIRATLECILIDFARSGHGLDHTIGVRGMTGPQEAVRDALIYIQHHFREPIALADVAHVVGLSPNYFSQCFHRIAGFSFQEYLQELRLRCAMSLLAVSDLSVTDVCHASGYNTLPHFDRVFTRKFGRSPRSCQPGYAEKQRPAAVVGARRRATPTEGRRRSPAGPGTSVRAAAAGWLVGPKGPLLDGGRGA